MVGEAAKAGRAGGLDARALFLVTVAFSHNQGTRYY
jgi:hypothetical protein